MSKQNNSSKKRNSVAVVVLGDLGRSPRMQYHCASLARAGHRVDAIAYLETSPVAKITEKNSNVHLHALTQLAAASKQKNIVMYVVAALLKIVVTCLQLLWILCVQIPKPSHILVQNPPSIPTLAVVWLACRLRGSKFVVDWHNFGHSIVALSHRNRVLLTVAERYERFFGQRADSGFCVSHAMKEFLETSWQIRNVTVLHDRPFGHFQRTSAKEKEELFRRLGSSLNPINSVITRSHPFKDIARAFASSTAKKPVLVVSSTSWTSDEDFSLLLDAVVACDKAAAQKISTIQPNGTNLPPTQNNKTQNNKPQKKGKSKANLKEDFPALPSATSRASQGAMDESFPFVLVAITGRGPQKQYYEEKISKLQLNYFAFVTVWLEIKDYPLFLGSADLGVSLHTSSSGLDLPMKVVDMFGCGVPVCAASFNCVRELVHDGENGRLFNTSEELGNHLLELLREPSRVELNKLSEGVKLFQSCGWDENWDQNAAPLFRS